jgi:hypothetical protein
MTSVHFTLMSHGTVLGHTGAEFRTSELPLDAVVWHLVPAPAFALVEPIVAELTAPPALTLVEEVIPTQDDYLHPGWGEQETQMERLMAQAARLHHFRLVLERYEQLDLELRDATGCRVPTSTLTIAKQMVPAETVRAFADRLDPAEARWVEPDEPCYLLMARMASGAVVSEASAA